MGVLLSLLGVVVPAWGLVQGGPQDAVSVSASTVCLQRRVVGCAHFPLLLQSLSLILLQLRRVALVVVSGLSMCGN